MKILILSVYDFLHIFDLVDEVIDLVVFQSLQYHHESDTHYIAIELPQCCLASWFRGHESCAFACAFKGFFDLIILKVVLEVLHVFRPQSAYAVVEQILMKDIVSCAYFLYDLCQAFFVSSSHFFTQFQCVAFVVAVAFDVAFLCAGVVYLRDELLREQTSPTFLLFLHNVHYIIFAQKKRRAKLLIYA